jgi:hypothetical protein
VRIQFFCVLSDGTVLNFVLELVFSGILPVNRHGVPKGNSIEHAAGVEVTYDEEGNGQDELLWI